MHKTCPPPVKRGILRDAIFDGFQQYYQQRAPTVEDLVWLQDVVKNAAGGTPGLPPVEGAAAFYRLSELAMAGAQACWEKIVPAAWAQADDDHLLEAVAQGEQLKAIAVTLGRSPADLRARLTLLRETGRRNLPARHGHRWSPVEDEHLAAMVRQGLGLVDIARTLDRTAGGIRARLESLP